MPEDLQRFVAAYLVLLGKRLGAVSRVATTANIAAACMRCLGAVPRNGIQLVNLDPMTRAKRIAKTFGPVLVQFGEELSRSCSPRDVPNQTELRTLIHMQAPTLSVNAPRDALDQLVPALLRSLEISDLQEDDVQEKPAART